ncbi:hypothetical protein K439DRAFT_1618818 [Ramaria rubella]|nr:hypothetical protein K439DRAFT_1618818 [Ramaria rubella]
MSFPGPPKRVTNLTLFADAYHAEITVHMNARHLALGLSTHHNQPLWQQIRDEMWHELNEDQQNDWHNRCASLIYMWPSNQDHLEATLQPIFEHLVGHDTDCIGDAVFHLQFAYHGQGTQIQSFSLSNTTTTGVSIGTYIPKYMNRISRPFFEWAQISLGAPPPPAVSVALDKDGKPTLPHLDMNHTSNAQFAVLLEEYLRYLWPPPEYTHHDISTLIPWDEIRENPSAFVDHDRIPPLVEFKCPQDMSGVHVQLLYLHILNVQMANTTLPQTSHFHFPSCAPNIEDMLDSIMGPPPLPSSIVTHEIPHPDILPPLAVHNPLDTAGILALIAPFPTTHPNPAMLRPTTAHIEELVSLNQATRTQIATEQPVLSQLPPAGPHPNATLVVTVKAGRALGHGRKNVHADTTREHGKKASITTPQGNEQARPGSSNPDTHVTDSNGGQGKRTKHLMVKGQDYQECI